MVNIDGSLYTQSGCLVNNKQKKKKTVLYGAFSGFNGIPCKVHKQNTWV